MQTSGASVDGYRLTALHNIEVSNLLSVSENGMPQRLQFTLLHNINGG